jgi:O-methyltransferase involved in polyketide biosynthesis
VSRYFEISPTALFVAYLRSLSDIPLAREIFDNLKRSHDIPYLPDGISENQLHWLAPIVECRYKSLNKAIRAGNYDSVLELAAGYSARGFELSESVSIYIDSDLPNVVTQKRAILEQSKPPPWPAHVHFQQLNVMSDRLSDAINMVSVVPKRGVAIICEGLFQYLDRAEMRNAALNILEVLVQHGGAWFTPDLSTKEQYERYYKFDPAMSSVVKMRSEATGRNMHEFGFETIAEIVSFFSGLGFRVERTPMLLPPSDISSSDSLTYARVNDFFGPYLNLWRLSPSQFEAL